MLSLLSPYSLTGGRASFATSGGDFTDRQSIGPAGAESGSCRECWLLGFLITNYLHIFTIDFKYLFSFSE